VIPPGFAGHVTLTIPEATVTGRADRPEELAGIGPVDTGAADLAGRRAYIYRERFRIYSGGRRTTMAKTLIEIDEEYLAAAQRVLGTATKKDTVNAALREVTALAARRRDLQRLTAHGLPDLDDEDVMRAAWQR
jgi:Arc/MetJ family transcription regulator